MNIAKLLGFSIGIIVGIVLAIIIFMKANKNGKVKTEYDERQTLIRGLGYKYSFYGTIIAIAVIGLLEDMGITIPATPFVKQFIAIAIGLLIMITYCIFNDGYWGLNNDTYKYTIAFILIFASNLICTIASIVTGSMFEDGLLQVNGTNLICTVLFLILGIEVLIKKQLDKKEAE